MLVGAHKRAQGTHLTVSDVIATTRRSGEDFFRIEGTYCGRGTPIPGDQTERWILSQGPRIDSDVELFDELCWRLLGDGISLWRANLHIGTLHPQRIRPAVVARTQCNRRVPHFTWLGIDRRLFAQSDPRHDRARDRVPPSSRRGHARIPAVDTDPGGRWHRLFRPRIKPRITAFPGRGLGDRPARRV
jgi:hypothetical protein